MKAPTLLIRAATLVELTAGCIGSGTADSPIAAVSEATGLRDAHDLLRFSNREHRAYACAVEQRHGLSSPTILLHGDPHLEQIAALGGRVWLDDYDDAAFGPASLDLLRALTSVEVAGALGGVPPERDAALSPLGHAVLDGYECALAPHDHCASALPLRLQALAADSRAAEADERGLRRYVSTHGHPAGQAQRLLAQELLARLSGDDGTAAAGASWDVAELVVLTRGGVGSRRAGERLLALVQSPDSAANRGIIIEMRRAAERAPDSCASDRAGAMDARQTLHR
ncbi:MAG: DUF2252 family protein, partial [Myxococcota bacterium]